MYRWTDSVKQVKGIGPQIATQLAAKEIFTIQDLLLWVPRRYEDLSTQKKIVDLVKEELVTIRAEVTAISNQYRGRRSIQRATVRDNSGSLQLIWFNSPYVKDSLKKGQDYFFSGKLNNRGMMPQPKIEKASEEAIHTNRLVPVYPGIPGLKQGNVRRWLKEIVDHLEKVEDSLATQTNIISLDEALKHLHFPDQAELTIQARERLALEELLALMKHSQQLKQEWKDNFSGKRLEVSSPSIPNLPFKLTVAQERSIDQILIDLQSDSPMNRLLLGDVGSGKTVVAGIGALHTIENGEHAALIAPTQILVEQHFESLRQLFPQLKYQLLTSKTEMKPVNEPTFFIGTHSLINQLKKIEPALVIYDEQHRFGVNQRSETIQQTFQPHVLTMSATPIPRSLMLTIFSHLEISQIDELPPGRLPSKTWLISEKKRADSYKWLKKELRKNKGQALIVCPFINQSEEEAFSQVAAVNGVGPKIKKIFKEYQVSTLHGKMKPAEKEQVIKRLYSRDIDILVTTPMIEVGVDLPQADVMMIESAERFGLASLHQLRGRVGRAGQQAYCLLFTSSDSSQNSGRLKIFCQNHDGLSLAEFDLKNRGAGDLFGTAQHGFDQLQFANWTNLELITQARRVFDQIKDLSLWKPLLEIQTEKKISPN